MAKYVRRLTVIRGEPVLYLYDQWYVYRGGCYRPTSQEALRDILYDVLALVYTGDPLDPKPWKPTKPKLDNVIDAWRGLVTAPEDITVPGWLDGTQGRYVPCANGLLRLDDNVLVPHSPSYLNLFTLRYDFDPTAECQRWDRFLREVFREDVESIELLKDWFYYVLSGRTELQKMLLWISPKRGGKGTVARVLEKLIGTAKYGSLSSSSLQGEFGLEGLLEKRLAVFADEDQGNRSSAASRQLVTVIKSVTGEDTIPIGRKHKSQLHVRLNTVLQMHTNRVPHLPDPSGAVHGRVLAIRTTATFFNREQTDLEDHLAQELPGILNWALTSQLATGKRDRFVQPASGRAVIASILLTSDPLLAFLESDNLAYGDTEQVKCSEFRSALNKWRSNNEIGGPVTAQWLGSNLASALLGLGHDVSPATQHDKEEGRPNYYEGMGLTQSGRRLLEPDGKPAKLRAVASDW